MPKQSEGIIKVPREVKNKGYEIHPIRNFTWLQVFYALKNIKKRGQKIKINASQNNSVLLQLGKQHHTGEKKNDRTDQQSFSPSLDISQDHGRWVQAKESIAGVLLAFFSSATGWWRILKLPLTKPPWPRSSCELKGWLTSPSKTALFPPSWWPKRNQIQPCGSAKHRDGRVSKAVLACKTMDDLANMMEWGHSGGMVRHSITINPKKSLTPKGHCQ